MKKTVKWKLTTLKADIVMINGNKGPIFLMQIVLSKFGNMQLQMCSFLLNDKVEIVNLNSSLNI